MIESNAAIIVCPLRYEASLIRRALRRHALDVEVQCCGLGAPGVERWAERCRAAHGAIVIMVGTCGSLRDDIRAAQAFSINAVLDGASGRWTPPLLAQSGGAAIVSVSAIVSGVADRRALGQRSGAALVDWESAAFARIAAQREWTWGSVRGVSDDFATRMPENLEKWLTSDGGMRIGPMLATIARKPRTIGELQRLHRNSKAALGHATALVAAMLRGNLDKSVET